ncbi:MAG: Citrate synthase 1 [Anaerolineae bacterium]|nr:Citrate synthase 1 [Anaerolineae bacterium]
MLTPTIKPGLEGVVAAETRLSHVDGQVGELIIGGYPLETLAPNVTFEAAVYLLWHDALPDSAALAEFRQALAARRELPPATLALLREAAARKVTAMDALRMAAASLSLNTATTGDPRQDALTAVASFPTIVAAFWRLRQGQEPIAPNPALGHAANYLAMLTGQRPSEAQARGLETYLNTVIDHGLNASTFTARVIISTQSDMISAVVGALGALKGPLHGGAPGPALDMVFEIGQLEQAEAYLRDKLERGERLMGFGHRIYKVRDPRAEVLAAAAEQFYHADGNMALYRLAQGVERAAVRLLAEYKPGRNLQTNVEFYTALLLHGLGLPGELFTPTFAIGRVGGWTAHCFEQQQTGRLIRPAAAYIGERNRRLLN